MYGESMTAHTRPRIGGRTQRTDEVEALMRLHGWSLDDACELVGIRTDQYTAYKGKFDHLPTPSDVEQMTLAIRDGSLVVSETSFKRWRQFRELQESTEQAVADLDDFDLGGRIADDDVELPAWLYSGDRAD